MLSLCLLSAAVSSLCDGAGVPQHAGAALWRKAPQVQDLRQPLRLRLRHWLYGGALAISINKYKTLPLLSD